MWTLISGRHLVVATGKDFTTFLRVMRNESGHIVKVDGQLVFLLEWIADRFNFTFSFLQSTVKEITLDDTKKSNISLTSLLTEGNCDLILAPVAPSLPRIQKLDFVYPFYFVETSYVMPKPDSDGNVFALLQPFQLSVWICLMLVTLPLLIGFLWVLNWYLGKFYSPPIGHLKNVSTYIVGLLFAQAGDSHKTKLLIRFVIGSWCISTFILTNVYSNLLTSYFTSPNPRPMFNSIYEISNHPEILTAADVGFEYYVDFNSENTELMKTLIKRFLGRLSDSVCSNIDEGLAKVKTGSYIYVSDSPWIKFNVLKDFMHTKTCSFMMGKETILTIPSSLTVAKKSLYLDALNLGTMLFAESGLIRGYKNMIGYFDSRINDAVSYCQKKYNGYSDDVKGLSLKNLTTAFVVLGVGYLLAFMALIGEKIAFHVNSNMFPLKKK